MSTQMVVCNVYRLLRRGSQMTKEGKILERSKVVISRQWAEEKNSDWLNYGKWYEILDDETEKFYEKRELARIERQKTSEIQGKLHQAMAQAVTIGSQKAQEQVDEIHALREDYKAKFDKQVPPRFKNDAEWIKSKLD